MSIEGLNPYSFLFIEPLIVHLNGLNPHGVALLLFYNTKVVSCSQLFIRIIWVHKLMVCQIGKEEGVWLHVDAAYAGAALVCPELRGFMKGLEVSCLLDNE